MRGEVKDRFAVVFFLGMLALNYPLLSLFSSPASPFGLPLFLVYVFGAWALLIGLIALVVRRDTARGRDRDG